VFGAVYEESVKGSPISIESIGRRAVNRLGVAPGSHGSFGEVFARSASAAGLAETTGDGKITLFAKPYAGATDADPSGSTAGTPIATPAAAQLPSAGLKISKPVLDQRSPFPDGEVALIVTTNRNLSAKDFASIGVVVGEIERLVAGLTRRDDCA
jgi:hypothetical protein